MKKINLLFSLLIAGVFAFGQNAITLTAITDFTTPAFGNTGKSVILTANQSIADLSIYGLGSATNGNGTDSVEYTFPAISVSAGEHILVCRDSTALSNYFDGAMEQFPGALMPTRIIENQGSSATGFFPDMNGNDAVELFENGVVIETFGDITHTYGSNYASIPWGFRDSWAWKDTAASNVGNWVFGTDNCTDGSTTSAQSSCPFPMIGGFQGNSSPMLGTWKLVPMNGSLGVGPNQGDIGWWNNSQGDVGVRGCIFDDSIQFNAVAFVFGKSPGWL
jgi:hypothetical protein